MGDGFWWLYDKILRLWFAVDRTLQHIAKAYAANGVNVYITGQRLNVLEEAAAVSPDPVSGKQRLPVYGISPMTCLQTAQTCQTKKACKKLHLPFKSLPLAQQWSVH